MRAIGQEPGSLARKLGVPPGGSVHLSASPRGWSVPEVRSAGEEADVTIAFCRNLSDVVAGAAAWVEAIFPDRALWIAWPRRAADHQSDITDTALRAHLLPLGVVDTKVARLDADWSGLRFVWRTAHRVRP